MSESIDPQQTSPSNQIDTLVAQKLTAVQANTAARQRRSDIIKFAILAVILIGTVAVIALLRPLIFGRIVPAIFAWDSQAISETETNTDTSTQDNTQTLPIMIVPSTDNSQPTAVDTPEDQAIEPTAVPSQTYVVQQGDTLNSIARQFNTTVEAITAANQITNPDALFAGATLIIPQP